MLFDVIFLILIYFCEIFCRGCDDGGEVWWVFGDVVGEDVLKWNRW